MKKLIYPILTAVLSFSQLSCSSQQKNLISPPYLNFRPVPVVAIPEDLENRLRAFWRETDSWFRYKKDKGSLIYMLGGIDDWSSAEETERRKGGECDDYFLYSCSKLSKLGFSKKGLLFKRKYKNKILGVFDFLNLFDKEAMHIVHLLVYNGLYGSSGQTIVNQYFPQYRSIEDLVKAHDHNRAYEIQYAVLDISDIPIEKGEDNKFFLVKERFGKLKWKKIER